MAKDYRISITVYSDREHPPVTFSVLIPEELGLILMATPVVKVGLSIDTRPHILSDKSKLVSFR